nr:hypothetical protein [Kibdelosporangium aridum]
MTVVADSPRRGQPVDQDQTTSAVPVRGPHPRLLRRTVVHLDPQASPLVGQAQSTHARRHGMAQRIADQLVDHQHCVINHDPRVTGEQVADPAPDIPAGYRVQITAHIGLGRVAARRTPRLG